MRLKMRNFGNLFASRESFAMMCSSFMKKPTRQDKKVKKVALGSQVAYLDLRLLTTTRSKGI